MKKENKIEYITSVSIEDLWLKSTTEKKVINNLFVVVGLKCNKVKSV